MGKVRKGKILVIAILMMIVSFFAFTGKVSAYWELRNLQSQPGHFDDWTNSKIKIHLYLDGVEINPGDAGAGVTLYAHRQDDSFKGLCERYLACRHWHRFDGSGAAAFVRLEQHGLLSLNGRSAVVADAGELLLE